MTTSRSLYFSFRLCLLGYLLVALTACSADKFLQGDETLLHRVKVRSDLPTVSAADYGGYIAQHPNTRLLSSIKVPLGIYCLSSPDSTKGLSRLFRRLGEAPVVYDPALTQHSCAALQHALQAKGYLSASVTAEIRHKGRKTCVVYQLHPGRQSYVTDIRYTYDNDAIKHIVEADSANSTLYKGMPPDMNLLDGERKRIIKLLQDKGYYYLHKEFITYTADTAAASANLLLTQHFRQPAGVDSLRSYTAYRLGKVTVTEDMEQVGERTTEDLGSFSLNYKERPRLFRRVYDRFVALKSDSLYSQSATKFTYEGLNALAATDFTTIHYTPSPLGDRRLDADVFVHFCKPHSIGFELEGTNTAGDLGAAASITYACRNLFRGAQSLSLKLRGAFEAIKQLEGYNNQDYIEFSAEATLRLPTLFLPIKRDRLRKLKTLTDISLLYNTQDRPEFHRRSLTASWSYQWNAVNVPEWRHRWDLVSLGYIYMPWISEKFYNEYLYGDDPRFSLLRHTYENIFIMRTGYSFNYNSLRRASSSGDLYNTNGYQVKCNVETASNLLYGLSSLCHAKKNTGGEYEFLGIPFSQYARFDIDYAKSKKIGEHSSVAFHAAFGIAIPYGNSSIIPYERRYFAGGANSVRGWSVRRLGPGSYAGTDGNIDFINQTGNMHLDLSVEFRSFLFWKLHGAAFIDAGNIWNTRDYANQPGGKFKWNTFYREIAVAYGLGLRLNFGYFILRFDGGMKAIDPACPHGRDHYPITHPNFSRDFTLHFAVGLPF